MLRTRKTIQAAVLAALLATFTVSLAAQAPSTDVRPPKLDFTTHTLANGMQVILLENHSVPVINLQVWYHVGGKDELPGHTGFAHLFEHLMFKGSAHVGTDEHSRIIEAVGGFDNARQTTTPRISSRHSRAIIWSASSGWKPTAWAASTWTRRISSPSGKWWKKSGACASTISPTVRSKKTCARPPSL